MLPSMNTAHSATQVMQAVVMPLAEEEALPESWFDSAPRLSSAPPARLSSVPPVEMVGEFLGDELADAWLR